MRNAAPRVSLPSGDINSRDGGVSYGASNMFSVPWRFPVNTGSVNDEACPKAAAAKRHALVYIMATAFCFRSAHPSRDINNNI